MFRLIVFFCLSFTYVLASFQRDLKISNGKNTTIQEHPYQLSYGYSGGHWCGAALIKPNVAITAAHCTRNAAGKDPTIRAGTTQFEKGGKLVKVENICQHPKFFQSDYDVAVLLLDQTLILDDQIKTIPLQPVNAEISPGTVGTITGWGKSSFTGGSFSEILQKAQLPKVSQEECSNIYVITDRMSCYGYLEGDVGVCNGDSGGPVVVDGKLAGLISWGYACETPGFLGVYTNLANEEISNHIEDCIKNF